MLTLTLRELEDQDADALHRLHLSCVDGDPHSFARSFDEVERQSLEEVKRLIKRLAATPEGYLLGAFSPEALLLGSLILEPQTGQFHAHKAHLWGVMVAISHRRRGIARQLFADAMERARNLSGVEKLVLELTGEALPALHLCRDLGFRIESVEPMALKQQGRYLDQIRMALYL